MVMKTLCTISRIPKIFRSATEEWGAGDPPVLNMYIYYTRCVLHVFTIYISYVCAYTLYNIYSLTLYLYHIDSIGAKLDAFQAPLAERSQSVTMNITHEKRCVICITKSIYILQYLIPSKPPSLLYDNSPHHPILKMTQLAQKVAALIVGLNVDSQIVSDRYTLFVD